MDIVSPPTLDVDSLSDIEDSNLGEARKGLIKQMMAVADATSYDFIKTIYQRGVDEMEASDLLPEDSYVHMRNSMIAAVSGVITKVARAEHLTRQNPLIELDNQLHLEEGNILSLITPEETDEDDIEDLLTNYALEARDDEEKKGIIRRLRIVSGVRDDLVHMHAYKLRSQISNQTISDVDILSSRKYQEEAVRLAKEDNLSARGTDFLKINEYDESDFHYLLVLLGVEDEDKEAFMEALEWDESVLDSEEGFQSKVATFKTKLEGLDLNISMSRHGTGHIPNHYFYLTLTDTQEANIALAPITYPENNRTLAEMVYEVSMQESE